MSFKTIQERKIRIAVLGCGRIALKHFEAIKTHSDNLELIAVCDNQRNVLDQTIDDLKTKGYLSLTQMLAKEQLDVIAICTPSGLHPHQTIEIANAGVNVISEKPMATKFSEGVSMVKVCDENNVKLFIVKQNRKNATIQLLKKAINENRFGKIHMVNINVFWTRPQEYYDQAKWRGTWELDGGAFMNQASHYVDLLDWLIGPVASVQTMMSTTRDIEVEDTGVMNIKWRNGALGSMNVTMLTYPKNLEGSITILGEKGTVKVGGVAVNEIQQWQFEDTQNYDKEIEQSNYETTSVYGFGHPLYYQNIVEVFRGKEVVETDGREGLKSLEILIAGYLSARNGKIISLPLAY
jgi:UDP-N-acetyl-2-amino-2-deoxyglucuronate dehydrogenase